MSAQVIVLGGGLAGMSAAHSVVQAGGRVLVLDKSPFCGGNSTKATSGINAAGTRSQRALGIPDSPEVFEADTLKSAAKDARPALIRTLTHQSGPSIEWLIDSFDLDLSVVSRLAAHTHPRTHRGKDGNSSFPGMMITYRLIERLEDLAAKNDGRVRILTKARATKLLTNPTGAVIGVEYEKDGAMHAEYGPVVIATGGFAADFAPDSLLSQVEAQWRESAPWKGIPLPPLLSLPTTNGPHCSGDGIKMALAVGAGTADLHAVQVHPTGLVEPSDPDAKVKWLAAEALRGCGGIILDREGNRFCDELGKRDYVTGRMWAHGKAPYRLILNTAARKQINWHCEHYAARGLMKKMTGADLAKEIGCPKATLDATFGDYNRYAATPGTDPWGKKYFNAVPFTTDDEFHVAVITPVIHYCMGGVAGNERAEVLNKAGAPIPGLYSAGEVTGGVHGENRLGGSSLLDCVVYGRIAGTQSARYLLDQTLAGITTGTLGVASPAAVSTDGRGTTITLSVNPDANKVTMDVTWSATGAGGGKQVPVTSTGATVSAPAAPTPAPLAPASPKTYTKAEVAAHNSEKSCWVIIGDKVYDVTQFLDDHPGGKKTILIYAGKDATKEFAMMHQPEILTKYGPRFYIGDVAQDGASATASSPASTFPSDGKQTYECDTKDVAGSTTQSWNSGGTAGELPAERAKASFDIEKLTNLIDGGVDNTKRRRYILAPLSRMESIDKYNMTRNELLEAHFRDFITLHKAYIVDGYIPKRDEVVWMSENSTLSGSLMPHMGLFMPTIVGQGDAEQIGWWLWKTMTFEMIGSYAQTELGHGSNVRGLRTTAEYDPATQEFVLNTPTLQSMKWWISGLGLAATHATVYAQLIIKGKEYGVHVFMVQLRDEDHKLLPGIEAGDVGNKMGDNAIDTGYLRLKNVRIPRLHLLSKRQHVEPDGTYVKHGKAGGANDKAHYLTMMQARAGMCGIAGGKLAVASTIAIRYSCVRRQGFVESSQDISYKSEERKILDYQVQQYRLFKQLATAFAIKFAGLWINKRFDKDDIGADELSDDIAEVHATSAGLKGLASYLAAIGIEDCRKACGGHGYLLNSGVASLSADYVWQTTAEGDFIVLLLQTARFLMSQFKAARTGEKLFGLMHYLEPLKDPKFDPSRTAPAPVRSTAQLRDLAYLISLFKHRALMSVYESGLRYTAAAAKPGVTASEAFNSCSLNLAETARSHCYYFMLTHFADMVSGCADAKVSAVMKRVCALFALSNIIDGHQWHGRIDATGLGFVETAVAELLAEIRPDAVPLVDAFEFHDRVLGSTIGRFDGNVYEALYLGATKSKLNQTRPFQGYKEHLQPHLDLNLLKLKNGLAPEAKL